MVCQSNSQCLWIIHLMHDLELDEDRFYSGARGSEVFNVHALGRGRAGCLWKITRQAILDAQCGRSHLIAWAMI